MNLFSFTEPFGPPSPLAPLSETRTIIVFSNSSPSSRNSQQPSDLIVGVREKAGVHLGHAGEQPLLTPRTESPTDG